MSRRILAALLLAFTASAATAPQALAQEATATSRSIDLPAPTGPHPVGVTTWHWIDPTRDDPDVGGAREMMVHAWYPAAPAQGAQPAPYRPLARNDHDFVGKASVAGAPFAALAAPAPVILICPGRGVIAEYNTALAEELASHGYSVFSFDLPGLSPTFFPDGSRRTTSARYRPTPELMSGPYEQVDAFFEPAVEVGSADVRFVLDRIGGLNRADPARRFTGQLDLSRIGIYGHSLGGRICGNVAANDRNVRAVATMEATFPRAVRREGRVRGAILFMYSDPAPGEISLPHQEEAISRRRSDIFFARFAGLGHNSSTDLPLIDENTYAVEPAEGLRIMRASLLDFFDAYVRERGAFPSTRLNAEPRILFRAHPKP